MTRLNKMACPQSMSRPTIDALAALAILDRPAFGTKRAKQGDQQQLIDTVAPVAGSPIPLINYTGRGDAIATQDTLQPQGDHPAITGDVSAKQIVGDILAGDDIVKQVGTGDLRGDQQAVIAGDKPLGDVERGDRQLSAMIGDAQPANTDQEARIGDIRGDQPSTAVMQFRPGAFGRGESPALGDIIANDDLKPGPFNLATCATANLWAA